MLLVGACMVAAASCTDPTSPANDGVQVDLAEGRGPVQ